MNICVLIQQIYAMIYFYTLRNKKIQLEKKEIFLQGENESIIFEHNTISYNKDWILIVLGGPFNKSNNYYIQQFLYPLIDKYNIGIVNHRGVHTLFYRDKATEHTDITGIKTIVKYISTQYNNNIYLAGFSLGSHIISLYLGTEDIPTNVKKFVGFSNYFDIENHQKQINNSFIVHKHTVSECNKVSNKINNDLGMSIYVPSKTFDEIIKCAIKKLNYNTTQEYYNKSCKNYLENIKVKTLFVNALDDFLTTKELLFNLKNNNKNKFINFLFTKKGGHLAWKFSFTSTIFVDFINS